MNHFTAKKEKTKSILEIDEIDEIDEMADSRTAADAYLNSFMMDMTSKNVKLCTYILCR
jgi:ATP-dependent 26S proteasome regulatory subunit